MIAVNGLLRTFTKYLQLKWINGIKPLHITITCI